MKNRCFIFIISLLVLISFSAKPEDGDKSNRPAITGISHASFFVNDLENTKSFYNDFLGFAGYQPEPEKDDLNSDQTYIKINDRQVVKVIPDGNNGLDRFIHFGMETEDVEEMRKYLQSRGIAVPEKVESKSNGILSFSVKDMNGTVCEFVQFQGDGWTEEGRFLTKNPVSSRMSHVGFMVSDADKALDFYCDILGFEEIWRGSSNGKNVTWVNLKCPEGSDYIELMLYDEEPGNDTRGVLNHICLEVPNMAMSVKNLYERMLPKGCKMDADFKIGKNRKRLFNTYNADGTRVEIMESVTIDGNPAPSSTAPPLKFAMD